MSQRVSCYTQPEFADVTENLLKPSNQFGLPELLNDPAYKRFIRSLSVSVSPRSIIVCLILTPHRQITDQPRERPIDPSGQRERHVILTLTVPPPSEAGATVQLVKGVFKLIDNLDTKVTLRPETKTKLKKVRDDLEEELKKQAVADKKEEVCCIFNTMMFNMLTTFSPKAENDKAAAKRKAIEEKLSKLSAAEQKKVLERERKRALRKTQGKVARK